MREEWITSRKNPLLVQIRRLASSRGARRSAGMFLGDGVKLLEEALKWGAPLETVVYSEGLDGPELPPEVRTVRVPEDVMASISPMESPQGALFLCRMWDTAPPPRLEGGRYLVLDGLQDPGNVGTHLAHRRCPGGGRPAPGPRMCGPLRPQGGAGHHGGLLPAPGVGDRPGEAGGPAGASQDWRCTPPPCGRIRRISKRRT